MKRTVTLGPVALYAYGPQNQAPNRLALFARTPAQVQLLRPATVGDRLDVEEGFLLWRDRGQGRREGGRCRGATSSRSQCRPTARRVRTARRPLGPERRQRAFEGLRATRAAALTGRSSNMSLRHHGAEQQPGRPRPLLAHHRRYPGSPRPPRSKPPRQVPQPNSVTPNCLPCATCARNAPALVTSR